MALGEVSIAQFINGILLGIFTSFALVMPTFAVTMVVVGERASNNKQLQVIFKRFFVIIRAFFSSSAECQSLFIGSHTSRGTSASIAAALCS